MGLVPQTIHVAVHVYLSACIRLILVVLEDGVSLVSSQSLPGFFLHTQARAKKWNPPFKGCMLAYTCKARQTMFIA